MTRPCHIVPRRRSVPDPDAPRYMREDWSLPHETEHLPAEVVDERLTRAQRR